MVLSKDELISTLKSEVRIILHLASKIDESQLRYRPSPKQRSVLELLQYLSILGPIHLGAVKAGMIDMQEFGATWQAHDAVAKSLNLEQVKEAIGKLAVMFSEEIGNYTDTDLRTEIELFGRKATRGVMLVNLVLSHYTAYRMQLFLYLKGCGHDELNTMNLWAGVDGAM